ncbi:PepSY-associated TM helix domain-containing protein [Campylobacter concisus]|uniref:PepSY-associated TM helix domain-containing protein n=1 Tax=Campylobacter concisus TaxID=199 RepID=UPI003D19F46D
MFKIWRKFHLILALIFALPLLIISISGAIISYHDEIIEAFSKDEIDIMTNKSALKIDEILKVFSKTMPNFNLSYIKIKGEANRAYVVSGTSQNGEFKSFFVDPYTGEVVSENSVEKFIGLALNLHKNLGLALFKNENLSKFASEIVAISTIALLAILLSGAFIQFWRFRSKFISAFKLNLKAKIYSLHGFLGLYLGVILLIICISGLYFSYESFAKVINQICGEEKVFKKPNFTSKNGFSLSDEQKVENLQKAYEIFTLKFGNEFDALNFILNKDGVKFMIFYLPKGASESDGVRLAVDTARGEILKNTMPKSFEIYKFMLDLHAGYIFKEAGKFIFFMASCGVGVLLFSGYVIYYKRRKK